MEQSVEKNLAEIKSTFRKYGAVRVFLFGSAAHGAIKRESDIDFLFSFPVDMDHETYANNYFSLLNDLRSVLKREVDLVAEKTLKKPLPDRKHKRQQNPVVMIGTEAKRIKRLSSNT